VTAIPAHARSISGSRSPAGRARSCATARARLRCSTSRAIEARLHAGSAASWAAARRPVATPPGPFGQRSYVFERIGANGAPALLLALRFPVGSPRRRPGRTRARCATCRPPGARR